MLERILEKLEDDCQLYAGGKLHLAGGSVGALGFSAGIQLERGGGSGQKAPQQRLVQLCRQLTAKDRGALILIDELQASSPEIRHLIGTYQEMVGEGLNVSLSWPACRELSLPRSTIKCSPSSTVRERYRFRPWSRGKWTPSSSGRSTPSALL